MHNFELSGNSTKFTLVFDLFSISDLLDSYTETSNLYIDTLIDKKIINSLTVYNRSNWITKVWDNKDIFVTKNLKEFKNKQLSLSKWSSLISSKIQNSSKSALLGGDLNKSKKHIDYRFSAIEVTAIDEPLLSMSINHNLSNNAMNSDKLAAELLGVGVIRIFKDSDDHINSYKISTKDMKHVSGDDSTLAILAVPFYFTASDILLGFFNEEDVKKLSHLRLIKSVEPNKFMLLLKLRSPNDVKSFIRKYQGRKFNSFEPETCSIVEIKEIIFRPKETSEVDDLINVALPYLLDDPFTTEKKEKKEKSKQVGPNRIYTELATCPVCLDRLDSNISGLFTIACQHTFHADCLSKWKDDSCPVCRHTNKSTHALSGDSVNTLESDEKCKDCEATENLWICLVCGNVGCGRYENKHALKHWEETNHCFSMEINTQRVWDYAEDGYVHRLVQNEVDGKIIELPLRDEGKKTTEEKIDKIGLEYSKLLISQLESQKEYYVAKLKEGTNKVNTLYKSFEKMSDRVTAMEISAREFDSLRDEMRKQQKACVKLQDAMCDMKALNSALIYKVKVMDAEKKKLENEKAELQEQVKDLMFYLESREKFKDASDEVKEGQILMTPAPVRKETKKKSSKGKK